MQKGTVERAFELATSGTYCSVSELQKQLQQEAHADAADHLSGLLIRRQLVELMKQSRSASRAEPV